MSEEKQRKFKLTTLQIPRAEAEEKLKTQIEKGRQLLKSVAELTVSGLRIQELAIRRTAYYSDVDLWLDYNIELLKRLIDSNDFADEFYSSGLVTVKAFKNPKGSRIVDDETIYMSTVLSPRITLLGQILAKLDLIPEAPHLTKSSKVDVESNNSYRIEIDPDKLRRVIDEKFDLDDLETLCYSLNVDFDNLGGKAKGGKIRELILKLKREDRILDLLLELPKHNPSISGKDFE